MRLIWRDSQTESVQHLNMGANVVGKVKDGQRPHCVELDYNDFHELFAQWDKAADYLRTLQQALKYPQGRGD